MSDATAWWLAARTAAAYLSLDKDAFLRQVKRGKFPAASLYLGERLARWDRKALDALMTGSQPMAEPRLIVTQAMHANLTKSRKSRKTKADESK